MSNRDRYKGLWVHREGNSNLIQGCQGKLYRGVDVLNGSGGWGVIFARMNIMGSEKSK